MTGNSNIVSLLIAGLLLSCSAQQNGEKEVRGTDSLNLFLNNAALIHDEEYNTTVFELLRTKTLELLDSDKSYKKKDNQWNLARMNIALDLFTDLTVRNYWIHSIAFNQIENLGIKSSEEMLNLFYAKCTDSMLIREIKGMYADDLKLRNGHAIMTYKTIDGFNLDAHIFYPPGFDPNKKYPSIVLFHGGSWYEGKCDWMFGACESYAKKGLVAIAIEYRLYDRHGVPPYECVSDAKSAIRWTRQNAEKLGIDPNKIAARGFSAGGHLVACTALTDSFNTPGEDTAISSSPNAMIFVSSCFDPTLDKWFVKQVEKSYPSVSCSPIHNIHKINPPSIVIHATDDKMCPFWTAEKFVEKMTSARNECKLIQIEGAGHFFVFEEQYREQLAKAMDDFLTANGYILTSK